MILIACLILTGVLTWSAPRMPVREGFVPGPPDDTDAELPDREPTWVSSHGPESGRPAHSTVEDVADAVVLLAVALQGGAALTSALDRVAAVTTGQVRDDLRAVAAAHQWGLPAATAWEQLDPCWRPVALVWEAAEQAGVAPAGLLAAAAQRLREQERARREARLQRSGVLLVLPLGGLFLPGFLATTVIPVVLHLLSESGR